jgi:hypothetical protein
MKKPIQNPVPRHTGVPSFFRYACLEASRGRRSTYRNAARELALHLIDQAPYDAEAGEWCSVALVKLTVRLNDGSHVPYILALVQNPKRVGHSG